MFIIVESGSTKADWVVVYDSDNTHFYKTEGINPATQVELLDLKEHTDLLSNIKVAGKIFFYGAGIIDPLSTKRISDWLLSAGFNGKLTIEEDMTGAARACCDTEPGIVCILGTGSNSCVYDGVKTVKSIPTLGYIFSDEGGGTRIGQEVLKAYFYGTMPSPEREVFMANYSVTKEQLIEKVYRSSGGNRYVASFAGFMVLTDGEWKVNILKKLFREFVSLRILLYPEHKTLPLKFVGSIAHFHRKYLEEVLEEYGLTIDSVIQQPIFSLIDYHLKHKIDE